jgi:serine/threonine-protein kinase RsbW
VRLELPSRLEVLDKAGEAVGQLAEAAGFEEDARLDIETAARECLVNAILHGNRRDETRRVTLEIVLGPEGLDITVRDEGEGFDPAGIPDPLAPENLCRTSGRGVLLMKALMDTVVFRRPAGGGMEVTMQKRLWSGSETAHHPSAIGLVAA